ncbi:MAG: ATP-dependent DNA helicase, partial [Bacteroidota bacterium]|nr:ATP-dependent DNA helicase [Bacteroidota bacterium]
MRDIHDVLQEHWGFQHFRPMQEEVIGSALDNRDTLALLPTGGGKSLCFQVPALAMEKLCLVVSPLIALMRDQVGRLRKQGIAAKAILSGMTQAEIENALDSALAGKLSFLYVSPERLGTDHFLGRLPRMPLGLIAVDEAHCISQWGYDFRPAYLKIQEIRAIVPQVPVIALTASATATVARDIMAQLSFSQPHIVRGSFQRPELVLWVSKGEDKQGRLLRILKNVPGTSLIYLRERKGTMRIAQFLKHHGLDAEAYHAGLSGEERDRIQRAWTRGETRIVVATNAFGMGIDKPDVRSVIHLDLPPDLESYYQEAGRAGRDGSTAHAFLLVAPGDEERVREKVETSFPPLIDIRAVYQAFADMNGIAMGSGILENYPLDIRAISDRISMPVSKIGHALKALELDGKLALSEGVRSPSRVLITTAPSTLYNIRLNDTRLGP